MENKTGSSEHISRSGKYFKYAIGEIILVVIGILIALSINNWNVANKTKKKEQQILSEILSDLMFNIVALDKVLNTGKYNLKRNVNSIRTLTNILQSDQKYHDSISNYFTSVNAFDIANFKSSGFQSLTSIGLDLIEDDKIRSSIGEFFTSSINYTQSAYDEVRDDYYNYMLDYYRKDFTTIAEGPYKNKLRPNNFEALKRNSTYLQSLRGYLSVYLFYLNKTSKTLEDAILLKENIENYIN